MEEKNTLNDIGFITTAYKQLDYVKENIDRIKSYNKLGNSKIVVVSTSEDSIGFKDIEDEQVSVIEWKDAPYPGRKHLTKRVLLSIQKGLEKIDKLNIKRVLHLHSDTYWKKDKENILINLFRELKDYTVIAELCIEEETMAQQSKNIPNGVHLHPEGLLFNISKCKQIGYGFTFNSIWKSTEFKTHNMKSIEAILGQYLIWCLSKKLWLKYNQHLPKEYIENVKILGKRNYHGEFETGLVNLKGTND